MRAAPVTATPTKRRAGIIAGALALVSTITLAGCQAAEPEASGDPVEGGTLVYASGDAEPTCLDPHVGGNYPQALISGQFLESLVSRDESGEIIPWLAESWEPSDDQLAWEFTLREGVEFTDGTPLDAEAVKVNVEHLKDPATQSSTGYLAMGKVDDRRGRQRPRRPVRAERTRQRPARVARPAVDGDPVARGHRPRHGRQLPGTHRHRPVRRRRVGQAGSRDARAQRRLRLGRRPMPRTPGPRTSTASSGGSSPTPRRATPHCRAAQVDVIDNPQPDTIAAAEGDDAFTWLDAPRPGASNRIELNSGQAPFDDERVREAFIRAVDVNDGIDSLFFGTAERSYSPLSVGRAARVLRRDALRDRPRRREHPARRGRLDRARRRRLPHEGRRSDSRCASR